MSTQDVSAASATPGVTGHPKGSPAERVVMHAQKIGQALELLFQEVHALTGDAKSPEAQAVRMIQEATSTLANHVSQGLQDQPMDVPADVPPDVPADVPAGPPMGSGPYADAAAGLHQDMMGSVPPGATPLP